MCLPRLIVCLLSRVLGSATGYVCTTSNYTAKSPPQPSSKNILLSCKLEVHVCRMDICLPTYIGLIVQARYMYVCVCVCAVLSDKSVLKLVL